MSLIKTPADIIRLRAGGRKLAKILKQARQQVRPGLSLLDLDAFVYNAILAEGCRPSFLGYDGYPNATCLSVNQQVVHGIPSPYLLKPGDVLGIDVGLWDGDLCVDSALTIAIPPVTPAVRRLTRATQQALQAAIRATAPYRHVGHISAAIEAVARKHSLGIVTSLTGHGVGHQVHEDPAIPNIGHPEDGIILRPGMVLAIEPMFTLGSGSVYTEIDGWTIATSDGSCAAHFEHTILVTAAGAEILTTLS
jgi:methionyl aminopeptidase